MFSANRGLDRPGPDPSPGGVPHACYVCDRCHKNIPSDERESVYEVGKSKRRVVLCDECARRLSSVGAFVDVSKFREEMYFYRCKSCASYDPEASACSKTGRGVSPKSWCRDFSRGIGQSLRAAQAARGE